MTHRITNLLHQGLSRVGLVGGFAAAAMVGTPVAMDALRPAPAQAQATPSLLEFRWEDSKDYKKLYYFQSSTQQRERAEYFLMLRPKDRKSAILKLTVTVPEYFNAKIKPNRVSLCRMELGGMLSRSRCKETIPAVIEVNDNQTSIEVFPDQPIPTGGTYAVVMKVFNPSNSGMYQFNALIQAPGDVPVAGYVGSWLIDID